jgi:acyl carrier protein
MADSRIVTELAEIVRSVAKLDPDVAVTAESKLVDDLGIDSLDLVGIFLQVQDRFDVVVDEDDIPQLRSLGELAGYIGQRLPSAAA